jgi:hypothetical protein
MSPRARRKTKCPGVMPYAKSHDGYHFRKFKGHYPTQDQQSISHPALVLTVEVFCAMFARFSQRTIRHASPATKAYA